MLGSDFYRQLFRSENFCTDQKRLLQVNLYRLFRFKFALNLYREFAACLSARLCIDLHYSQVVYEDCTNIIVWQYFLKIMYFRYSINLILLSKVNNLRCILFDIMVKIVWLLLLDIYYYIDFLCIKFIYKYDCAC